MKKVSLLLVFISTILKAQVVTIWTQTFGSNGSDQLESIFIKNQNILLLGTNEILNDPWIIQTDIYGNENYNTAIHLYTGTEYVTDGIIDDEDNIIITGEGTPEGLGRTFLAKSNLSGDIEWFYNTYGGYSGYSILPVSEGGYIVGAITFEQTTDLWVFKVSDGGQVEWEYNFVDDNGEFDFGEMINVNEGYVIFGRTNQNGSEQSTLIKIDNSGNHLETYNNDNGEYVYPISLIKNYSGGYVYSQVSVYSNELIIISTDSIGQVEWQNSYTGFYENHGDIIKTQDSSYVIGVGRKVFKINPSGELLWEYEIPLDDNHLWGKIKKIIETNNGRYLIGGTIYNSVSQHDYWLINLVDTSLIPCFDPVQILGDLDNDGQLTILDLNIIRNNLNDSDYENECFQEIADFNQDGIVNDIDCLELIGNIQFWD